MDIGTRLKQARLEAGLSQRQLCGDTITRNMLSRIENGAARPSMDTLAVLAARLGKSVSWFLGEEARSQKEQRLGEILDTLAAARLALEENRPIYAGELLDALEIVDDDYCAEDLQRQRLLLLARSGTQHIDEVCRALPSLDEELLLRAQDALSRGLQDRTEALLESVEQQNRDLWYFLRGQAYLARENYKEAAEHLQKAEAEFHRETAPLLERCFRELGDYRQAYHYACKQR